MTTCKGGRSGRKTILFPPFSPIKRNSSHFCLRWIDGLAFGEFPFENFTYQFFLSPFYHLEKDHAGSEGPKEEIVNSCFLRANAPFGCRMPFIFPAGNVSLILSVDSLAPP